MIEDIPGKTITINLLEEMFANITDQSELDMTKPLLWRYFFTQHEPKLLETAKVKLINEGYRYVSIYLAEKKTPSDLDMWWLHIEKEEVHTPQSLDKRNDQFYLLARELGLKSYDGMDVGPIIQK